MLRSLILCLPFVVPAGAIAQTLPSAETHGDLIDRRMEEAAALGGDLESRLQDLQQDFDLPEDLVERALDSLDNGRVRAMLGVSEDDLPQLREDSERYPGGVYLFASFSIPEPSLKAMLRDADRFGIPVVFNGFVENSVLETEKRVRAIFEGEDIASGFTIDPTLFERFDVSSVPTLVSTTELLDVCATTGCTQDARPPHDRVSGNVPLETLLRIISKGNAEHAAPATAVLEAAG